MAAEEELEETERGHSQEDGTIEREVAGMHHYGM